MATFLITDHNGNPLAQVPLGATTATLDLTEPLAETRKYGFEVADREADTAYHLWIGDLPPDGPAGGRSARGRVTWDDAPHFESGNGRVTVQLRSRPLPPAAANDDSDADAADDPNGGEQAWRVRAVVATYIQPTKLTDDRYSAMAEQMRRLAAGLVFDLISKSTRSVQFTQDADEPRSSGRSSQLELQALADVWRDMSDALRQIAADPMSRLTSRPEVRACWGGERILPAGISRLVAAGVDPRRRGSPRPFAALCQTVHASVDTPEHRAIAGVLALLRGRVRECVVSVQQHIRAIEVDRPMRDRRFGGQPSLYQTQDRPRLDRLEVADQQAADLAREMAAAARRPFLRPDPGRPVLPTATFPNTPVFQHVEPYRRLRAVVDRYLFASTIVLDDGADLRVKSTSRMYEQWVFIQLASALRRWGLTCRSGSGLLGQRTRYRFTLDVDRDTRITFEDVDGRGVNLRYEPWIYAESVARQRHDLLFQNGTPSDGAWSPDMVLEFTAAGSGGTEVEHAVIVDAKYTRVVQESHWSGTSKYLQIRSVHDRRQVARQLWLVHPTTRSDVAEPIRYRDSAVRWSRTGAPPLATEIVQGIITLVPPAEQSPADVTDEWIAVPSDVILEFVEVLLRGFGIRRQ